jgi:hypothetical protein
MSTHEHACTQANVNTQITLGRYFSRFCCSMNEWLSSRMENDRMNSLLVGVRVVEARARDHGHKR